MEYVIMIGQLFLSLSILIVLHEMGHFFPAKWFKTRVEKFYLFFDPWFSLFKYKKGDTEYGIGWLPLGGYVKISGMIDESMDTEQMKEPAQPWEFRSKPAWQRLIIMLGGVTVNFILGFLLLGMVLYNWGESYLPTENATYGIAVDSLGMEIGLKDGDKVIQVGDKVLDKMTESDAIKEIIFNSADKFIVERKGSKIELPIDEKYVGLLASSSRKHGLYDVRYPFFIDGLPDKGESPAKEAGILKGDQIIAFNGTPIPYFHNYDAMAKKNKGKYITLSAIRKNENTGEEKKLDFNLTLSENGLMGVIRRNPYEILETKKQTYSLGEALPMGFHRGVDFLGNQMKAFGKMFSGDIKVTEGLGGFGSIGKLFGSEWIWERFWKMTAIISLILAFMNLLPIPALDGGHVMFLLYEIVTGRKPSDTFMEYATIAGFVFIMGLVLMANGLDIIRWWKG